MQINVLKHFLMDNLMIIIIIIEVDLYETLINLSKQYMEKIFFPRFVFLILFNDASGLGVLGFLTKNSNLFI